MFRKLLGPTGYKVAKNGVWGDQPIFSMVLGICSALAITNKVANAIAMGAGVTFVLIATAAIISLLRSMIPQRVRIITYMVVIASFVIIVDKLLQAFAPIERATQIALQAIVAQWCCIGLVKSELATWFPQD